VGTVAEILHGDPPSRPDGCIAQAWNVAETLRAWQTLSPGSEPFSRLAVS
jgi:glycogen debranching enzyme